ncbi:transmembrane protein 199 [Drosophila pseudoobscura]|uniref:Transmembrane protein 199 n=1 Tax=Drosophila pseudoobscura pseudoobscura TaxID=46245 RepID=A0A6I8UPM2_DROPS|nr:transmembrane protein 199 [Drosophila pseudoobscura]
MLKSTIVDTRVRLVPSKTLLEFLDSQKEHFKKVPENVAKLMKNEGYILPLSTQIVKEQELNIKRPNIDRALLRRLTADVSEEPEPAPAKPIGKKNKKAAKDKKATEEVMEDEEHPTEYNNVLYLTDMHWLNDTLIQLRKDGISNIFLYELIESSDLLLPENEMKPRNPDLEARCERLRAEQHNREYHKMTKNVDAGLKHYPEDTIAYQIKSLNKQIIAVVQFVFSVAAGFTFGFFGVNLMVGPLPFGFRILLGVIVALIIALAEMYFLAKKLHEYDEVLDAPKRMQQTAPKARGERVPPAATSGVQALKPHAD